MNKNFFKQAFLLVSTSTLLYFSGSYLTTMPDLKSFFDGMMVMTFFFSLFPFLIVLTIFSKKILKTLFNPKMN
ncbi:MAG: hypothetical protein COZ16_11460 [Flavobacteriaceae bacterium CG_4_10_14_3_um_filter_31_253]|nr:MAG: hypothetical protein AUK46_05795 [Flavobacteriaceae bacterium CG2_30_31_66]PIV96010.1 MAG: hypothetical protein COW43_10180 [Flavobacteriaceae bacterium CG17_big_fil_post_rev_8_21_14_2_50_31_13]PIX12204.1 MAG: hypothetical protein COZ74_12065 [Flavobacteriaceae bacterium CG_4_8_14_3_um_filter_31_8]PIY13921.1 MAG: hypothetical protein COZ16_11460 [Flavobacteriaceae bacterium CG_4_10_14_3_um_filter_31_253]PIZ10963.1 MAG: hypothetical protein COY55_06140 [Flavobacteriaceae bacterium CG_4_1